MQLHIVIIVIVDSFFLCRIDRIISETTFKNQDFIAFYIYIFFFLRDKDVIEEKGGKIVYIFFFTQYT